MTDTTDNTDEQGLSASEAAALNTELDNLVPAYRVARRTAAGFFDARDALKAGQNFATQKYANDEARAAIGQMNTACPPLKRPRSGPNWPN